MALIYNFVKGFFFITLFFSISTFGQDQEFSFNHLDNSMGLSHNRVYSMIKDKNGFMWFGTANGLCKFDGYEFITYYNNRNEETSLTNGHVSEITKDQVGRIWVNADRELNIYDPVTEKIIPQSRAIYLHLPRLVNDIFTDKNGNIWIAGETGGLFFYHAAADSSREVNLQSTDDTTSTRIISGIGEDNYGNIYAIDNGARLYIINKINFSILFKQDLSGFQHQSYYKLYIDNENKLWIFSQQKSSGIFVSNHPVLTNDNIDFQKINTYNNSISCVTQDSNGLIWIGTDHGGLNIYNKKTHEINYIFNDPFNKRSICQNSIESIYCDPQGVIWVGTFKRGVSYYHPQLYKFKSIKLDIRKFEGNGINDIDNFAEDNDGNLWIGTNGAGLFKYNKKTNTYTQYKHDKNDPKSLSADIIIGMCVDSKNRLWAGTYFGGLNYFDGATFHHYKHNPNDPASISDNRVWDIKEDSDHNLWISTIIGGLDVFDPDARKVIKNYSLTPDTSEILSDCVFSSIETSQGEHWIATARGASRLLKDKKTFIHYSPSQAEERKLTNEVVYEIIEDSRGLIWVATFDGLNLIDPGKNKITRLYTDDGLPSKGIMSLQEDNMGNIWAASDNGLCQIVLKYQLDNENYDIQINNFNSADGINSPEFNHKSSFKSRQGQLFFGGSNGYNIVLPVKYDQPEKEFKVVITGIDVFNEPIKLDQEYEGNVIIREPLIHSKEIYLLYNQNVINIKFSALYYLHPGKIKYKYRLVNFKNEWLETEAGSRQATFTNLDPGHYNFQVQISDDKGKYTSPVTELNIHILAPWWQQKWFGFLIIAVLIAMIILVYYFRLLNLQKSRIKLENLVKIRTSELQKNNAILKEQSQKLNAINQLLEERQHYIEEQANKLSIQKKQLEKSNIEMHETNSLLEERQQLIEEQSEELRAQKEELEEANSHLKELNSMKNKFFSIIAHDLKNPLSTVLGFSELLNKNLTKLSEEKKEMYSNKIYHSSRKINNLLENLLHWARTQTDNIIFEPTTLNLKNIVIQAITLVSKNIISKNITVAYENSEFFNVYADRNMTYTIIRNLVTNAVKFTENGGRIDIWCEQVDDYVKLLIKDNGIGMTDEEVFKLFRIDQNFSKDGTAGETGTGLGLILCKEFVLKNGGDIRVNSKLNEGTTFQIMLPQSEYVFNNAGKDRNISILTTPKKAILVVEDEPTNFYLIKKFLKDVKSNIYWAKNGKEAVNMIIQNDMYNIGLLFMDIQMPHMDGFEALKRIRNIDGGIPIIAQSAYIEEMTMEDGLKKGFSDILTKPLNKSVVIQLVNKFL